MKLTFTAQVAMMGNKKKSHQHGPVKGWARDLSRLLTYDKNTLEYDNQWR